MPTPPPSYCDDTSFGQLSPAREDEEAHSVCGVLGPLSQIQWQWSFCLRGLESTSNLITRRSMQSSVR